jgi:hypothetical protein
MRRSAGEAEVAGKDVSVDRGGGREEEKREGAWEEGGRERRGKERARERVVAGREQGGRERGKGAPGGAAVDTQRRTAGCLCATPVPPTLDQRTHHRERGKHTHVHTGPSQEHRRSEREVEEREERKERKCPVKRTAADSSAG